MTGALFFRIFINSELYSKFSKLLMFSYIVRYVLLHHHHHQPFLPPLLSIPRSPLSPPSFSYWSCAGLIHCLPAPPQEKNLLRRSLLLLLLSLECLKFIIWNLGKRFFYHSLSPEKKWLISCQINKYFTWKIASILRTICEVTDSSTLDSAS